MEAILIKAKVLKLFNTVAVISIFVPTNIFVYATSTTDYVTDINKVNEQEILIYCNESSSINEETKEEIREYKENEAVKLDFDIQKNLDYMQINTDILTYNKNNQISRDLIDTKLKIEMLDNYYNTPLELDNKDTDIQNKESIETESLNEDYKLQQANEEISNNTTDETLETNQTNTEINLQKIEEKTEEIQTIEPTEKIPEAEVINEYTKSIDMQQLSSEVTTEMQIIEANSIENQEQQNSSGALIEIENKDQNYYGTSIALGAEDRSLLEHLVMGESGGEDIASAALVAQAIRDAMISKGYQTVADVREALKYSGSISKEPNQNVLDAVSIIFDQGGMAVQHEIIYFYAPRRTTSKFHEKQEFIIEYGGHRFFD